jgi:hypothetical protein
MHVTYFSWLTSCCLLVAGLVAGTCSAHHVSSSRETMERRRNKAELPIACMMGIIITENSRV